MKKRKFTTSFDDLIENHYGGSGQNDVLDTVRVEELFASSYGKSVTNRNENTQPTVALSFSNDNGETLAQRWKDRRGEEYVAQRSIADTEFEEYVVERGALSVQSSDAAKAAMPLAEEVSAFQEYQVDILQPLKETIVPDLRNVANASESETVFPSDRGDNSQRSAMAVQPKSAMEEISRVQATDDDFAADMQAILTGQAVFDPHTKTTVRKDELSKRSSAPGRNEDTSLPLPESKSGQDIFEQIAKSMQYANAYDMGTIELENRFADFDKIAEIQQKSAEQGKSKNSKPPAEESSPSANVDSADFIQDLDTIRSQHSAISEPSAMSPMAFSTDAGNTPTTDVEIENLNLAETAKKAATALKKKHPTVTFTSGRRTKQEQAHAMAGNIVQNRKWIEQTYVASGVRDACQKWIDDNPEKKAKDEIEEGLVEVFNKYTNDQLGALTKHISGMAFDVQPVEDGAEDIKKSIRNLEGLDKFLEKEGGLVRWHAQFK